MEVATQRAQKQKKMDELDWILLVLQEQLVVLKRTSEMYVAPMTLCFFVADFADFEDSSDFDDFADFADFADYVDFADSADLADSTNFDYLPDFG